MVPRVALGSLLAGLAWLAAVPTGHAGEPREVRIQDLDGREQAWPRRMGDWLTMTWWQSLTIRDSSPPLWPGEWATISLRHGLEFPYTSGAALRVEREGARVFVRVDGEPRRLAGVAVTSREGLVALRELLDEPPQPLILWCSSAALGHLPPLPPGRDLTLCVVNDRLEDVSSLSNLTALKGLRISLALVDRIDLAPLARLQELTELDLLDGFKGVDVKPLAGL